MLEKIFSATTMPVLNKAMDISMLRDTVIANNIANVETPYFKRSEVIFEKKLKKVLEEKSNHGKLKTTNPRHIQIGGAASLEEFQPDVIMINDESYRNDENNVDIDVEMAKRSKNEIYYDSLAQCMTREIRLLRLAITGKE